VRTGPPKPQPLEAADANPPKNEMPIQKDTLQGLWRAKGFTSREAAADEDLLAFSGKMLDLEGGFMVHVEGNKLTLLCAAIEEKRIKQWTLKVVLDQTPKRFELTRQDSPVPEKDGRRPDTITGTYELLDNVLRIGCLGELFLDESLPTVPEGHALIMKLERVEPEYAEALMPLQGLWKLAQPDLEEKTFVLVEGEWMAERGVRKRNTSRFRLGPAARSAELSSLGVTHVREITFLGLTGGPEKAEALCGKTADGKIAFLWRDVVIWERASREDLAETELKPVMSKTYLAEKKRALTEFIAQYAATQAAQTAREELQRMPPDEEILELDAGELLRTGREHLRTEYLTAAKHIFQTIVNDYAGTEAAQSAKQELQRMPPEEEIREIEAARTLESVKKQLRLSDDRKQKLSLAARKRIKAAAEERLRRLVKDYPGTKAAAEAARLLDPAVQRAKEAPQKLTMAKLLLEQNPQRAKERLEELVKECPGTKEAQEAKQLLEKID
jgi:hypothetical protein